MLCAWTTPGDRQESHLRTDQDQRHSAVLSPEQDAPLSLVKAACSTRGGQGKGCRLASAEARVQEALCFREMRARIRL